MIPVTRAGRHEASGVLAALEAEGVACCLWRPRGLADGGDVDVAVPPMRLEVLTRAVSRASEAAGGRLVHALPYAVGAAAFYVDVDPDGPRPRLLKLDLSPDLRWRGRPIVSSERTLATRVRGDETWVACAPEAFRYYLVKRVMKEDAGEAVWDELRDYWRADRDACAAVLASLLDGGPREKLAAYLEGGSGASLGLEIRDLARAIVRRRRYAHPLDTLAGVVREQGRLLARAVRPRGLLIALLGPDGSGKTAVAGALFEGVQAPLPRDTGVRHVRPGLLPARAAGRDSSEPHGRAPYGVPAAAAKLAFLLFDYTVGYLVRVYPLLARGRLVVFYRYAADIVADEARYRFSLPRAVLRGVLSLAPRPVYVVLDAPAGVLRGRKDEVSVERLETLRAAYRDERVVRAEAYVDAGRELAVVVADVERVVVRVLAERLRRRGR